MSTIVQAPPLPENPYPGIRSFRYLDQQLLTARDQETWKLLRNVLIYRGVLLYGDSGSGKSSLINAGLIPAALEESLIPERLRIQPREGKEIKIERIPIEREDKPPYLPSVFIDENSADNNLLTCEIPISEFYQKLLTLKTPKGRTPRPLLVFDQFEEFVTLFEEALRVAPVGLEAQDQLTGLQHTVLKILVSLMLDEALPVKCLFVFREDYLAKLNPLFESCPELLNQFVRLLPPRVDEAEAIIRAPFANAELRNKFTGASGNRAEISPGLARTVAQQLQQRSEAGFVNLSELQIVCKKLWDSNDPDTYFEESGRNVQRVVEQYWSDVLNGLRDLYEPALVLLGDMVTASGTRNIISEPDLKTREKDLNPQQIEAALKALVGLKLVRREPRNMIYFYEIVSEFLVPWILQKKTARLAEVRAFEAREQLRKAEQEKRYLKIGGSVLAVLFLLAVASTVFSLYLRKKTMDADKTLKHYIATSERYKLIISALNKLSSSDRNVRLKAVKDLVKLDADGQLDSELVPVILAVSSNDSDPEVSLAASHFFRLAESGATRDDVRNSAITVSILKSAENNKALSDANNLAPRVYIQVASDGHYGRANRIAAELRTNGFTVPGFELVDGRRAPKRNELRFYRSADEQSPDPNVEKLLALVNGEDNQKWTAEGLPPSSKVRSGHFELWFGRDSSISDGTLILSFTDEETNPIWPEKFQVSLRTKHGFNLQSRNIEKVAAPPGTYKLRLRVPGYEAYESDVEISPGIETVETVMLRVPYKGP